MIYKALRNIPSPDAANGKIGFIFGELYHSEIVAGVETVQVLFSNANDTTHHSMPVTDPTFSTNFTAVTTQVTPEYELYEVREPKQVPSVNNIEVIPESSVRVNKFSTLTEALTLAHIKLQDNKLKYTISKPMYVVDDVKQVEVKIEKV